MLLHVSSTGGRHQEVKIALHSVWYHHTYRCGDTRDRFSCRVLYRVDFFSGRFSKKWRISKFTNTLPVGAGLPRPERRTGRRRMDMTTLIVTISWTRQKNASCCPHIVFVCFVRLSEQTEIISPYSINWLVFITETECVYCAVRLGPLNVIQV